MVETKKKTVFLVNRDETFTGKHMVFFGRDLNNPRNARGFSKLSDAKKFALKKAREIGVKSVTMDLPKEGHVSVKVPMINKREKRIRRTSRRTSIFDIGF